MLNPASERMKLGHAARHAGRTGEALEHYRSAVEQDPGSAEANSVYGLMLLQLGRAGEAEAPLRKAVEIAPGHAALRMNLAQWLAHRGDLDEAVGVVAGIVKDEPQHWWAWERLGELNARQKKFGDASKRFARANELKPGDPSLLFKHAQALFDDGKPAEAERVLGEAAAVAPTNAAILRLYADLHESRSDWNALEKSALAWCEVHPWDAAAWRTLAKAQWELGRLQQAMENFRKSMKLGTRDARNLVIFGRLCLSALEFDSATAAIDEAEKLEPDNFEMLSAKAILLMLSGRYDEAQDYCRRSISANPSHASAYKTLAQLSSGRLPKADLEKLAELAGREDMPLRERVTAAFALAECRESEGNSPATFAAYDRANRLAHEQGEAEGFAYERASRAGRIDELIAGFQSVPVRSTSDSSPRPVFILGMPRSGTTLIESVIGAHSKVFACGERMAALRIMPDYLVRARNSPESVVDADTWRQWREYYLRGLPDLRDASVFTDKNPWNYEAVGLIAKLFPDAAIIHVRRNPVDTGFSIFRNQFPKQVQFDNRLEDIGHYYGEYARLMAHWERVAGDRVTTIQYEGFVRDFDTAGPALLAECGLEWESSCRNFWESKRLIGTMSTMQARRPLETVGGRADKYTKELQPLADSLRAAGVDLQTGALRTNS